MKIDGDLKNIVRRHLLDGFFQSIETGSTSQGVADVYYCFPGNKNGWIEMKFTKTNTVSVTPMQVAWHERLWRSGGRTFFMVRQKQKNGLRRIASDMLWMFAGNQGRDLMTGGIKHPMPLFVAAGIEGPESWDWKEIRRILTA